PRAGKARIDERGDAALARDQREFGALGLPFRAETFLHHPVAIEGAAVSRSRFIDAATLVALTMRAPHARRLVEIHDRDHLAAKRAGAAGAARNDFRLRIDERGHDLVLALQHRLIDLDPHGKDFSGTAGPLAAHGR